MCVCCVLSLDSFWNDQCSPVGAGFDIVTGKSESFEISQRASSGECTNFDHQGDHQGDFIPLCVDVKGKSRRTSKASVTHKAATLGKVFSLIYSHNLRIQMGRNETKLLKKQLKNNSNVSFSLFCFLFSEPFSQAVDGQWGDNTFCEYCARNDPLHVCASTRRQEGGRSTEVATT